MSQHKIVTDYHSLDNSELKKLNRMVVSKNLKLVSFELELDDIWSPSGHCLYTLATIQGVYVISRKGSSRTREQGTVGGGVVH